MKQTFLFAVVMAVYNTAEYVEAAIDSVLHQTLDFNRYIQLILVDDGSTDGSGDICDNYQRQYPDNITVLHQTNAGRSAASNAGLLHVSARYVNFLDSDDYFSLDTFEKVASFYEAHEQETDVVSVPMFYVGGREGAHRLYYKFASGTRVIDLNKEPRAIQLHLGSSFIKSEVIAPMRFDTEQVVAEDARLCMMALRERLTLGVVSDASYYYRIREDGSESLLLSRVNKKAGYTYHIRHFSCAVMDYYKERYGAFPKYVQCAVLYEVKGRLRQREIPAGVMSESELTEYRDAFAQLAKRLDDDVILSEPKLQRCYKAVLLTLKYGQMPSLVYGTDDAKLQVQAASLGRLSALPTEITAVCDAGNAYRIEGYMVFLGLSQSDSVRIVAKSETQEYEGVLVASDEYEDTWIGHVRDVRGFQVEVPKSDAAKLHLGAYIGTHYCKRTKVRTGDAVADDTVKLMDKCAFAVCAPPSKNGLWKRICGWFGARKNGAAVVPDVQETPAANPTDWRQQQTLDDLVERLGVTSDADIFQTYYNYSPFLRSLKLPFTPVEETVLAQMEHLHEQMAQAQLAEPVTVTVLFVPTAGVDAKTGRYAQYFPKDAQMRSVLEQTYEEWEIVLCGYEEQAQTELLESVPKELQSRVRAARSLKEAVAAAKGEYIAWMTQGCRWANDFLAISTAQLKARANYSGVYSAQYLVKGKKREKQRMHFAAYMQSQIENRNEIALSSLVCRRSELFDLDVDASLVGYSERVLRALYQKNPLYGICVVLGELSQAAWKREQAVMDCADLSNALHLDALKAVDVNQHCLTNHWSARNYPQTERKTAIIIPSYEVLDCLIACIEAVRAYTPQYIDYELIIVDNCSSEVVTTFLKRLEQSYEDVTVILNEHNMGFTYAVNQGIKAARPDSDYVLLNNDAIVTKGWLDALYQVKDEIAEAGLIVPRQQLVPHRRTIRKHVPNCNTAREVDVNLSFWHGNIKDLHKYAKKQYVELNFAPFFLVLITKECFARLGCLDEVNGRHYESDTLYCKAAQEQGIAIVYTPYSKVYHLLQQATKNLKEHNSYMYDVIFKKNNWDDLGDSRSYEEANRAKGDN